MSDILSYKCPNCGGSINFDIEEQKMLCPYCESMVEMGAGSPLGRAWPLPRAALHALLAPMRRGSDLRAAGGRCAEACRPAPLSAILQCQHRILAPGPGTRPARRSRPAADRDQNLAGSAGIRERAGQTGAGGSGQFCRSGRQNAAPVQRPQSAETSSALERLFPLPKLPS